MTTLRSQQWIHKYEPKTVADIICNKRSVKLIAEWLDEYSKKQKRAWKYIDKLKKK